MMENKKDLKNFLNILLSIFVIILMLLGINSYFAVKYLNAKSLTRWPEGAFRINATGYEMSPSFSASMHDGSFFVHSHQLGYRIPKFADDSIIKEGGVLSVGCSFTYGDGVEAEQTFTYLFADSLGLPSYNYGVCSYSYANIILQLKELKYKGILDKLKPTIIILGAGDWLFERSLSPFLPTGHNGPPLVAPYVIKKDNIMQITYPLGRLYISYPFNNIMRKKVHNIKEKIKLNLKDFCLMSLITPRMLYVEFIKKNYKIPDISSFELYNFVISEIKKIILPYQMKFLILWMPAQDEVSLDEGFKKALEQHSDVILVDGSIAIKKYGLGKKYYVSRHPSPEVHRVYAKEMITVLRQREFNLSR